MNKELKRRIYAIALSGIILAGPKMKAYADEIDNETINTDHAISELVPNYTEADNNCYHLFEEDPDEIINSVNPTCTTNGSYDELYYCVKCGEERIISKTIEALGHNWSDPIIENYNENGYDIVNKCQNNDCDAVIIQHMNYDAPTESINQNQNENQNHEQNHNQKNNQDQNSKSNDNNDEHSESNSNLKVALTSLGVAGASIYAATKIKKLNKIKIKKIKKIKINKPYKGKYLGKKK